MPSLYRGTSLIRNTSLLVPYRRTMSRVLWWPQRGGLFLTCRHDFVREFAEAGARDQHCRHALSVLSECVWVRMSERECVGEGETLRER